MMISLVIVEEAQLVEFLKFQVDIIYGMIIVGYERERERKKERGG